MSDVVIPPSTKTVLMLSGTALLLGGCVSAPAVATVNMHSRVQYSGAIDNLFVAINLDSLPRDFAGSFPVDLQQALTSHGVRSQVRGMSDLDLQPVGVQEVASFRYAMVCRPTHIEEYQYVVNMVTINCSVLDVRTRALVLRADVKTIRGVGFRAFGENEAAHASLELVNQMQASGLIAPPGRESFRAWGEYAVAPVPSPANVTKAAPLQGPLPPVAFLPPAPPPPPVPPAPRAFGSAWVRSPPSITYAPAETPTSWQDTGPTQAPPATDDRVVEIKVLPNGKATEVRDGGP